MLHTVHILLEIFYKRFYIQFFCVLFLMEIRK